MNRKQELISKAQERLVQFRTWSPVLEQKVDQEIIIAVERAKRKVRFDLPADPQQAVKLKEQIVQEIISKRVAENKFNLPPKNTLAGKTILDVQKALVSGTRSYSSVFKPINDEVQSNRKNFPDLKQIDVSLEYGKHPLRVGVLGFKVGMMSTYDKWGVHVPLTVVQVDRCQVTQVKETADPNVFGVQVGGGAKSLNRITKAQIGHFLKHSLIPNTYLREFEVTRNCLLPVGFRLGPRHFTPGQLVDVRGIGKDKGVQGAMKKWGFGGQPASHGVSVAHRSLGSTGQKQWPSKVFKGKKMHGYMGGHTRCVYNLRVFKVDHERSLIYLWGAVPGKQGELIEVQDARFSLRRNFPLLNFPTFIPEVGKHYANMVQMDPPIQDPSEVWMHENALPPDDEDEDAAASVSAAAADLLDD